MRRFLGSYNYEIFQCFLKASFLSWACLPLEALCGPRHHSPTPGPGGGECECYLWANNASPTINVLYEPSSTYSFNAQNRAGGISVTKTGRPAPIRSHAPASAAEASGAPAATCRSRHMDLIIMVPAMSQAGARAERISPRRSTAMAVAAQEACLRTARLICCSSGRRSQQAAHPAHPVCRVGISRDLQAAIFRDYMWPPDLFY